MTVNQIKIGEVDLTDAYFNSPLVKLSSFKWSEPPNAQFLTLGDGFSSAFILSAYGSLKIFEMSIHAEIQEGQRLIEALNQFKHTGKQLVLKYRENRYYGETKRCLATLRGMEWAVDNQIVVITLQFQEEQGSAN